MLFFRKPPVAIKFFDKRLGGGKTHIFRRKNFVSRSRKNFVGENFCAVFQKYSSSDKVFRQKGESGEKQEFTSKSFCVTVTKTLVGEPFLFH